MTYKTLRIGSSGKRVSKLQRRSNEVLAERGIEGQIRVDGELEQRSINRIGFALYLMGVSGDAVRRARRRRDPVLRPYAQRILLEPDLRQRTWPGRKARQRRRLRRLRRRQVQPVISRSEWGAAGPRGKYVRQSGLVAGVQHHTAYPALPAEATVEQESERMREIQDGHFARGFTDIGYAFIVFPSGRIYEGRPKQYVGAHTLGYNTGYGGWALDGNYETDQPTPAALRACHRCRELLGVTKRPLYGHYQLQATACPGRHLKPHLGKEI